jgi:hypothetical protein
VGHVDRSVDGLGIMTGDLFLRSSRIYSILLSQHERLSRTSCREHICVVCIRFLLQDVHCLDFRI